MWAIVYGNSQFVITGNSGAIFTTPDGVSVTARVSGSSASLRGAAYGNGLFVVVFGINSSGLQADGKIWLGGDFKNVNFQTIWKCARLKADGTTDISI